MLFKATDDILSKLWDALDEANGNAKKHVALPGDVFGLATKAEESLSSCGLPARERVGAQVVWHGAGAPSWPTRSGRPRSREDRPQVSAVARQ